jgi:hypothetical protein
MCTNYGLNKELVEENESRRCGWLRHTRELLPQDPGVKKEDHTASLHLMGKQTKNMKSGISQSEWIMRFFLGTLKLYTNNKWTRFEPEDIGPTLQEISRAVGNRRWKCLDKGKGI